MDERKKKIITEEFDWENNNIQGERMKRRIRNNKKEWKCDMCNQWFEIAVCDDCWEKIHPSKHGDLYKQARETVDKTKKLS